MRNWNLLRAKSHPCIKQRCEPTYEELKQIKTISAGRFDSELRAYLWGIETLIGRKFYSRNLALRAYLWGIETHGIRNVVRWCYIVASLPMRNWNRSLAPTETLKEQCCEPTYEELKPISPWYSIFRILVASLPMRNWNIIECLLSEQMSVRVASLPMRNWNGYFFPWPVAFIKVASLPMRNWNVYIVVLLK